MNNESAFKSVVLRGAEDSNFRASFGKPKMYCPIGVKGSGKSALLELIASQFPKIIDLYGSRDNEGLAWLRSPFRKNVLFLKGLSANLDCNCADVQDMAKVSLKDLDRYDVIVSCASFYSHPDEEFDSIARFIQKLWHRQAKQVWFVIIREAGNILFSRLDVSETQRKSRNWMIYVFREMRHCNLALGVDALRSFAIDINVRELADYTFFKALGVKGFPRDLRFLYRYVRPKDVRDMPVDTFVMLSLRGAVVLGKSVCPPWHKQEGENLLEEFHIHPEYKEMPFIDSLHTRVDDYEHLKIIKLRATGEKGENSMGKIGLKAGRSSKTIHEHITQHNSMVHAIGECDKCARVNGPFAKMAV